MCRKQLSCCYDNVELDESARCLRFSVSNSRQQWRDFAKVRSFPVCAMPLSASKESTNWMPVENPRGLSLGELSVPKKQVKKILSGPSEENLSYTLEVHPDEDVWDKCSGRIPREGFLVSEIFADVVPIRRQEAALDKLVKGEYVNTGLPNFLFDAAKAKRPDAPVLGLNNSDAGLLRDKLALDHLNDEQKMAVAKLVTNNDLGLLQGPPGSGKTEILAAATAIFVTRGQRVLVASQSNVAVDRIFESLARLPEIRPLRFGRNNDDSQFSEKNVIDTWLGCVKNRCSAIFTRHQKVADNLEAVDRIWPRFADMLADRKKLVKKRSNTARKLHNAKEKSTHLARELAELKGRYSTYSSAVAVVDQLLKQHEEGARVIDAAEWVKLIAPSQRADIFQPLKVWLEKASPPDCLKLLIRTPAERQQDTEAQCSSLRQGLLKKISSLFRQTKSGQTQQFEPNWSVQWIRANDLMNRLGLLGAKLPPLLEACREVERVCAAIFSGATDVDDDRWAEVTNDLDDLLQSSGKAVAEILDLNGIAASLKPKRRFTKKLSRAKIFLQQVLEILPSTIHELRKAFKPVGRSSVEYLSSRLTEASKQIERKQSSADSLKQKRNEITNLLADIEKQLKNMQDDWNLLCRSLPADMRESIDNGLSEISSKSLKSLEKARSDYVADTKPIIEHHKRWGPVHKRWLSLLNRPTQADRQHLTAIYIKRCNVVGVTCSWSGNSRILERDEFSRFDVVIIDECSKATPPELLMPALLGARLILAGDYRQLPPTFKEGRNLEQPYTDLVETDPDFEQIRRFRDMVTSGLFKQLYEQAPDDLKQYLVVIYRFPAQILELINQFYDITLKCGIDDSDERFEHGLHIETPSGEFLKSDDHALWIDTSFDSKHRRVRERQVGSGKANDTEAQCVVRLIKMLNKAAEQAGKAPGSVGIGIIALYGAQVQLIKKKLSQMKTAEKRFLNIRADTVDDFQGQEKEIVILSMVRSKPGRIGDFAKRFERINVAMSRAQKLLIILAAAETFRKVEVPIPTADGGVIKRLCYANILDSIKRYGGLRNTKELLTGTI